MSERTTAEMVEYLGIIANHPTHPIGTYDAGVVLDAADRLAELDAALEAQIAIGADLARAAFADLLPPCPTCRGTIVDPEHAARHGVARPCPDCVDGKVSIEQLVATYNAVFADELDPDEFGAPRGLRDFLRSVKP